VSAQTLRPRELIFVDAGSIDDGPALIEDWWRTAGWPEGNCRVLSAPNALPGAGRNAGVRAARCDWIAFLDGGITPDNDWLECLFRHAQEKQSAAVFGMCYFSAASAFSKAVCALSYGHGSAHPVIPASLFQRTVFNDIGFFPEELRAGEDLVWINRLVSRLGPREICLDAHVQYTYFPTGWGQSIRKWRITEYYCVLAGVRARQQLVYLTILPTLYLSLIVGGWVGEAAFLLYLLLRGVLDPVMRSHDTPWWGRRPLAAAIAPILAVALDLAKLAGILQGILARMSGVRVSVTG
jgi:glycosyltransferase involved in cell wall biosynthesis